MSRAMNVVNLVRSVTVPQIAATVLLLLVVRVLARVVYRVTLHPLSRFPGPKLNAATHLPQHIAGLRGRQHVWLCDLHEKYGPVVRTSPEALSFIGETGWRDVYGHGAKGNPGSTPHKSAKIYRKPMNNVSDLVTAPDSDHARMRRIFTPAFSERALKQQEPLFRKYADLLVEKLKGSLEQDSEHKFDMVRAYNFTTFDVMGDLTFGEPLHMLAQGEYTSWVSLIFGGIKFNSRLNVFMIYPVLAWLLRNLTPKSVDRMRREHFQHSIDRVTKRIEHGRESEGVDLWSLVLEKEEGKGLSREEMDSNASLFMTAGTETTATLLSGLTYLLCVNPEAKQKIVDEIRALPKDGLDMETLAALPYLNACIKEALRMYPPLPIGLPRVTPADGTTICGEFIPPGWHVSVPHLATYTSNLHFKDAKSFIPERWLGDERYANDNRAVLQPFSVGTRDCLGKNMAYHEMRLIAARVLHTFDIELCPESAKWTQQDVYVLWEKHPLMCKLRPVEQ